MEFGRKMRQLVSGRNSVYALGAIFLSIGLIWLIIVLSAH
jgi:hypothetical protein